MGKAFFSSPTSFLLITFRQNVLHYNKCGGNLFLNKETKGVITHTPDTFVSILVQAVLLLYRVLQKVKVQSSILVTTNLIKRDLF
jgi:hypothetical protein